MRLAIALLLMVLAPPCLALDVWEFTLSGVDGRGRLVVYYPGFPDDEDAALTRNPDKDAEERYLRIKIDRFLDNNNRIVLRDCVWDRLKAHFECKAANDNQKTIRYETTPLKSNTGQVITKRSDWGDTQGYPKIIAPREAKKIHDALHKADTCALPDLFLVCKENCSPKMPKSLFLGYCGD